MIKRLQRRGSVGIVGLVGLLGIVGPACATDVQVVGVTPGRSAMLVIDGAPPLTLGVGEGIDGVTLLRADVDGAEVRVDGTLQSLPLVAMQGGLGSTVGGGTIRLKSDSSGHFTAAARVNGRPMTFLVDTGATLTTLSRQQAESIGLRYRSGTPARASTANGVVEGWRVRLDSVRIGTVTVTDVDAMVLDTGLPMGLLGMSFLDQFNMERQGTNLVLRRR